MQISVEETWEAAQKHLRSKLSPDTYNLWFAPLRAHAQGDDSLVLEVPNDFCEVWLKDNYTGLLQDVVALASGRQLEIQFKIGNNRAAAPLAPLETRSSKATVPQPPPGRNNNIRYSTCYRQAGRRRRSRSPSPAPPTAEPARCGRPWPAPPTGIPLTRLVSPAPFC